MDEPESLGFAMHHGFAEADRQVEQVRTIGVEPYPPVPAGLEIVTVAQRPELWPVAYHAVAAEAVKDMAVVSPLQLSLSEWSVSGSTRRRRPSSGWSMAKWSDSRRCTWTPTCPTGPSRASPRSGVSSAGRGIAATLKRVTLWWAAGNGIREVYTWTQNGNENMRRLNEHLGFRYGQVSIDVVAPLPLTVVLAD